MPLQSFIPYEQDTHFPLENLPYGVFRTPNGFPRIGTRVGDTVIDLAGLVDSGLLDHYLSQLDSGLARRLRAALHQPQLNALMGLGRPAWRQLRQGLQRLLASDNHLVQNDEQLRARLLIDAGNVEMLLPATIGDYTDFYSSRQHATNVGKMFRDPENALLPNWLWLPVGYHGRASSVVVSGTPIHRPHGQIVAADAETPHFATSQLMDFELEMGYFVGPGNELGQPIMASTAGDHIFGLVLVNDWSARDIQKWEYVPLGPFLAKNLATSISPWVVTLEALEPFRRSGPEQEPAPFPYLQQSGDWSFDIQLEVKLQAPTLANGETISRTNFLNMYWSMVQQLAHHTISGCNLRPGDLLASGTISGDSADSYGSMLELTWRGSRPLALANGESRKFLQDGDIVNMSGWAQGDGYRVGFGELIGQLLPAVEL